MDNHMYGKLPINPKVITPFFPPPSGNPILLEDGTTLLTENGLDLLLEG